MARKCGRPPVLDEIKQREITAIVSMGCSRRTAARYVGCAPSTIQNTAERDEKFAERLDRAQSQAVVTHMKNINSAAKKAQYWRAAAWALERLNPEEYAHPHADMLSAEQIFKLLAYLSKGVVVDVPISYYLKKIMKRLREITKTVSAVAPEKRAGIVEENTINDSSK
jgi:IS30 family transposase